MCIQGVSVVDEKRPTRVKLEFKNPKPGFKPQHGRDWYSCKGAYVNCQVQSSDVVLSINVAGKDPYDCFRFYLDYEDALALGNALVQCAQESLSKKVLNEIVGSGRDDV